MWVVVGAADAEGAVRGTGGVMVRYTTTTTTTSLHRRVAELLHRERSNLRHHRLRRHRAYLMLIDDELQALLQLRLSAHVGICRAAERLGETTVCYLMVDFVVVSP